MEFELEITTGITPRGNDFADDFFEDLRLFDITSNSEYLDKLFSYAKFITVLDKKSAKIISFLAYYENTSYTFISMLWTSKQYRNRGLGSTLLRILIDLNYPEIRIEVEQNYKLINFYESKGFRTFVSQNGSKTVIMRRNYGVAVMQPYFLPSLQYFQLIGAVRSFVFLDDASFRKRSFINRNSIRSHWLRDDRILLTVPVTQSSQNRSINKTLIVQDENWKNRIQKSILHSYSKAPYFEEVFSLLSKAFKEDYDSVGALSMKIIVLICGYLDLNVDFYSSSHDFSSSISLPAIRRLTHITKSLGSTQYINSIGGTQLYKKEDFQRLEVSLSFLDSDENCRNLASDFTQYSFLDNLMRFSRKELQEQLTSYKLA